MQTKNFNVSLRVGLMQCVRERKICHQQRLLFAWQMLGVAMGEYVFAMGGMAGEW